MKNIVIIGSTGHARVVIDIVELEQKYRIAGLIDRVHKLGRSTLGYEVIGVEEDLPELMVSRELTGVIVAIGDNFTRSRVVSRVREICAELAFVSAVHPGATIGKEVSIGAGSVIMAGVVVNACSRIGQSCILNTNSSLDHDCVMKDFSSLAPNVATGGNCTIGELTAIGIGSSLSHGVSVGNCSVIGAGSTVLKDIAAGKLAYGTPADLIRDREPGDKYL